MMNTKKIFSKRIKAELIGRILLFAFVGTGCVWSGPNTGLPDEFDECDQILAAAGKYQKLIIVEGDPESTVLSIWEHETFIRWHLDTFNEHPRVNESEASFTPLDYERVFQYLHEKHETLFNRTSSIKALREKSLRRALKSMGVSVGSGQTARTRLKELSKANRQRILTGVSYRSIGELKRIEALIDNLELLASHNSTNPPAQFETPLLSAHQLKNIGFSSALNMSDFNAKYLQTDDQVFFYGYAGSSVENSFDTLWGERYGAHPGHLELKYLQKEGWMSPFVMDPEELVSFATYTLGASGIDSSHKVTQEDLNELLSAYGLEVIKYKMDRKKLLSDFRYLGIEIDSPEYRALMEKYNIRSASDLTYWKTYRHTLSEHRSGYARMFGGNFDDLVHNWEDVYQPHSQLWDKIRLQQQYFQLTPEDYLQIVRTKLKAAMRDLKRSKDPEDQLVFQLAIKALESGSSMEVNSLLNHLVYEPLNMPLVWELKVPVLVDHNQILENPFPSN